MASRQYLMCLPSPARFKEGATIDEATFRQKKRKKSLPCLFLLLVFPEPPSILIHVEIDFCTPAIFTAVVRSTFFASTDEMAVLERQEGGRNSGGPYALSPHSSNFQCISTFYSTNDIVVSQLYSEQQVVLWHLIRVASSRDCTARLKIEVIDCSPKLPW